MNEELRAQMSIVGSSQSQHTQSRQIASWWTIGASFLRDTKFFFSSYSRRSKEEPLSAHQTQSDEDTSFTQALRKRRRDKRSHLFDTMWAWLRPQAPGVEGQPHVKDLEGTSKSTSHNKHIWLALSTTKAVVGGSASEASPTQLHQLTARWHTLHVIHPPYH